MKLHAGTLNEARQCAEMMRRRNRWYGIDGQSRARASALDRSSGTRRIFSLVILLVLVLVLIQLTSDTKRVEKAAKTIGLLPNTPIQWKADQQDLSIPSDWTVTNEENNQRAFEGLVMDSRDERVRRYRDGWSILMERIPKNVLPTLARVVFSDPIDRVEIPDLVRSDLESWIDDTRTRLLHWGELVEANATANSSTVESTTSTESLIRHLLDWLLSHRAILIQEERGFLDVRDDAILQGLQLALDKQLLDSIVDNAPWESIERIPFVRSWQRVDAMRAWLAHGENVGRCRSIEFSKFGFDANRIRGIPIRFQAEIVRVDRQGTLTEDGFETYSYRVIWVRPSDASDQPVCVYIPDASIHPRVDIREKQFVTIAGFFLKRLAYASQRGSDIAPLIQAAMIWPESEVAIAENLDYLASIRVVQRMHSKWMPPVDRSAPLALVRHRLSGVLESIDEKDLHVQDTLALDSVWTNPFLELERLVPELDRITASTRNVSLTDSSSIVRGYGQVVAIKRYRADVDSNPSLGSSPVYRLRVQTPDSDSLKTVWTRSIPQAWLHADGQPLEELRQPCQFVGLSVRKDSQEWIWAPSMKWAIDTTLPSVECTQLLSDLTPRLSPLDIFLISHGWDLAWKPLIQQLQSDPIQTLSSNESEAFYRLLEIAHRFPYDPTSNSKSAIELIEGLRRSGKATPRSAMERTQLSLRVVRATRVAIADESHAAMIGSDQYFQLDCMADIGNRLYEIPSEKEPIVYHKEYPVTVVAKSLPDWMMDTSLGDSDVNRNASPQDRQTRETVSVWYPRLRFEGAGWFYRYWSHKTKEITQALGDNKRQIAPLVFLDSVQRIGPSPLSKSVDQAGRIANWVATAIGVGGALLIWWYLRRTVGKRK